MSKPALKLNQDSCPDQEKGPDSSEHAVVPIRHDLKRLLQGPVIKRVFDSLRKKFYVEDQDLNSTISTCIFHLYATNVEMSDLANRLLESLDEVESLELLKSGASRYLSAKFNLKWVNLPPETQSMILQLLRTELLANPRLNIQEALALQPIISELIEEARSSHREMLVKNRDLAINKIDSAFPFMSEWQGMEEGQEELLNERYYTKRSEQQFLSTYFDSATFGLVDSKKEKEVLRIGRRSHLDFESFMGSRKKGILNSFEPGTPLSKSRYSEKNLFFCGSASQAFRLFAENYLEPGEVVLVTDEEYQGMRNIMEKRGVRVEVIPKANNPDEFENNVSELIRLHKPTYVLMSEVGRRGTIFPVDRIRNLIDKSDQTTELIIDGTQTVGRKPINFGETRPDVYFASCQKGSDYGGPSGALVLSSDFVHKHGSKISSGEGTEDTVAIERFYRACDRKEVSERQNMIRDLSLKLFQAICEINSVTGDRIKILYPSFFSDTESGGIFELEIEGMKRYDVNKFCRDYGVFVAHHYFSPAHKESFRIALHPCMSNDSIKILAYALYSLAKRSTEAK